MLECYAALVALAAALLSVALEPDPQGWICPVCARSHDRFDELGKCKCVALEPRR